VVVCHHFGGVCYLLHIQGCADVWEDAGLCRARKRIRTARFASQSTGRARYDRIETEPIDGAFFRVTIDELLVVTQSKRKVDPY
jgi:hypothetical protein